MLNSAPNSTFTRSTRPTPVRLPSSAVYQRLPRENIMTDKQSAALLLLRYVRQVRAEADASNDKLAAMLGRKSVTEKQSAEIRRHITAITAPFVARLEKLSGVAPTQELPPPSVPPPLPPATPAPPTASADSRGAATETSAP